MGKKKRGGELEEESKVRGKTEGQRVGSKGRRVQLKQNAKKRQKIGKVWLVRRGQCYFFLNQTGKATISSQEQQIIIKIQLVNLSCRLGSNSPASTQRHVLETTVTINKDYLGLNATNKTSNGWSIWPIFLL